MIKWLMKTGSVSLNDIVRMSDERSRCGKN